MSTPVPVGFAYCIAAAGTWIRRWVAHCVAGRRARARRAFAPWVAAASTRARRRFAQHIATADTRARGGFARCRKPALAVALVAISFGSTGSFTAWIIGCSADRFRESADNRDSSAGRSRTEPSLTDSVDKVHPSASGPPISSADESQVKAPNTLRAPLDIVLISIDTLRPDHLGAYGYERPTSPNLDALAARGVVFENAFVQASWTLPSHMSMLTSTYPHTHQVHTEASSLPEDIPTLAEVLNARGYDTAGFVTWIYLSARFGFGRGFDSYRELVPPSEHVDPSSHYSVKAEAAVDTVLAWADTRPQDTAAPYFLFVHLFDPHMDYEAPFEHVRAVIDSGDRSGAGSEGGSVDGPGAGPEAGSVDGPGAGPEAGSVDGPGGQSENLETRHGKYEFLRSYIAGLNREVMPPSEVIQQNALTLYDAEIHYTDAQVGRLLDGLGSRGLLENAVVIVTSDHGEEFFEHGSMEGHQWTLYDEVLHVPLLVVLPGNEAEERRIQDLVQSIDIAPTVVALAGSAAPATFEGRSLTNYLRERNVVNVPVAGSRESPEETSFDETADGVARGVTFAQIQRFNQRWSYRTATHKTVFTLDTKTNRFGVPIQAGYEVYDLRDDPGERNNRFSESDSVSVQLSRTLHTWGRSGRKQRGVAAPELTPEERERLRSLGYTSP